MSHSSTISSSLPLVTVSSSASSSSSSSSSSSTTTEEWSTEELARRIQDIIIGECPIPLERIVSIVEIDMSSRREVEVILIGFLPNVIAAIVVRYVRDALNKRLLNSLTSRAEVPENAFGMLYYAAALRGGRDMEDVDAVVKYCLDQGAEINGTAAQAVNGVQALLKRGRVNHPALQTPHGNMIQRIVIPFLEKKPDAPMQPAPLIPK